MTDTAYAVLLAVMLTVSFLFGAVWFVSPLGIGFAEWPKDAAQAIFARRVYTLSYAVGLPLLAVGQVWGLILWNRRRPRQGLVVSAVTFGLSFGAALLFLALMP